MAMILGVIADDSTGATDVASMLVRSGMRTVQCIGVPDGPPPQADAVVVALKTRTCPAPQAVHQSLQALRWLQQAGARQFYFKYCSTFDSTPEGNIGPVAEALQQALGTDFAIACPAFPENGRTVYRGHLFVGDALLSDSGMRDHPLTPMTDANLVRVLQAQVRAPVGLAPEAVVRQGSDALRRHLEALRTTGHGFAVVDAIDNQALHTMAAACDGMPLITAGSGVAMGLPEVYVRRGWLRPDAMAAQLPAVGGRQVVLSGSCSQATRAQVAHWMAQGRQAFRIDPLLLAGGQDVVAQALSQWQTRADEPMLFYATAEPDAVKAAQQQLGVQGAGDLVEKAFSSLAQALAQQGVRRFVVAGGETSGSVVQALEVDRLRIGPVIDPGVPWTQAGNRELLLALKSGNFGSEDFFSKALAMTA